MAKLKRKKGLKDVTGDGKFTYADVLKMRGVKPKKSMENGGRPGRMKEMKRLYVGSPFDAYTGPIRKAGDYMDRLYDLEDQGYPMNRSEHIALVDQVANPEKYNALSGRGIMEDGGTVPMKQMKRLYVGSPFDAYSGPIRKTDDYMDRLYDLEDQGYHMNTSANISLVDQVANPGKYKALKDRGLMAYGGKVKSMNGGGRTDEPPSFTDRLYSNLSNAAEFLMPGPAGIAYKAYKSSPDYVKEGVHTALGGPLVYLYNKYMDGQASEAAESARPDQDPHGFVGPVMPGEDVAGPTRGDNQTRPPRLIRREAPVVVEPLRPRGIPENAAPRNRQIVVPREEVRREISRDPFVLPDNLRGMGKGGVVEYGIGGAVMGGINALMAGKGLAGAAGAAARGMATPGSGFAQGAQLAGNLAAKSNNPMVQNIGKMAGMASNFLPGGNPMGALGALGGLFQQKRGGYVSKHRLLRG